MGLADRLKRMALDWRRRPAARVLIAEDASTLMRDFGRRYLPWLTHRWRNLACRSPSLVLISPLSWRSRYPASLSMREQPGTRPQPPRITLTSLTAQGFEIKAATGTGLDATVFVQGGKDVFICFVARPCRSYRKRLLSRQMSGARRRQCDRGIEAHGDRLGIRQTAHRPQQGLGDGEPEARPSIAWPQPSPHHLRIEIPAQSNRHGEPPSFATMKSNLARIRESPPEPSYRNMI